MAASLQVTTPTGHGLATYPPGATFGPRRMRDYEWVWMVEGDAEYRRNEQVYPAPEGSIVLCRPGATDFFRWDPVRRTRHAFFHFDVTRIPRDWPPPEQWPNVVLKADGDVLLPLFQHVLTWVSRGDPLMIQQATALMLRVFVTGQRATMDLPADVPPDPVDRAIAFMHRTLEADPAAPIALDELADAACVTPEHLCRIFKRTLDRSPMECVRQARLDRSAVLLSRSNCSVGEVAELCGFASQFHFSRRFKEAYGRTPTAFRLKVREGATPPPSLLHRRRKTGL